MPANPDPSPSPGPSPSPLPKPKRTRSAINQALSDELDTAEQLAATAAKAAYSAQMTSEAIDSDFLENLNARITEADALVGGATGKTSDKATTTRNEETLKKNLLKLIQVIQTRAKRKYKDSADPARDKYFIGERLGSNRPLLERATRSILTTLDSDALPGLKPAEVTGLSDALSAYVQIQGSQTGGQSDATTARSQLEAKVKEVADLRREIQYAADILWPAADKANAGIRTEFKIPPTKALK